MYISYIIFTTFFLICTIEAAVELSVIPNEKSRALPLKVDEKKVIDKEKGKERGWHNWGSPQWGEPDTDTFGSGSSGSNWQEPSVLPLPAFSGHGGGGHGSGHGGSHGGSGGGHGSNFADQSGGWDSDQSSSDLLPQSDFAESEHHSGGGWGGDNTPWLPDSNGGGDSSSDSDSDWNPSPSGPSWGSHSSGGGHTRETGGGSSGSGKPCNCDKDHSSHSSSFNSYNQPPPPVNYPSFSSGPSYAPIRPNKHHKSPVWSHWDSVPWNTFEKGSKDKNHIKGSETEATAEEVVNKSETNPEVQEPVNVIHEKLVSDEVAAEQPVPTNVVF